MRKEFDYMICEQCSKQMPDDSTFCPNCGAKNGIESEPNFMEEAVKPIPVVQQPVQQPIQPAVEPKDLKKPLGVLGFMGTLFVLSVPFLGIVMMFVWAFGSRVNKNRKNLSIALMIYMIISIVLTIIFGSTVFLFLTDIVERLQG